MRTTILLAILTLLATAGSIPAEETSIQLEKAADVGWWRRNFGTLTWEEAKRTIASPEDAVKLVKRHIRYKADIGDQLTDGKKTWENGYGDCEDIAQCIVELCRSKGWETWVEVFASKKSAIGHAVAMGRRDGKMWMGNDGYASVTSMEDAKVSVARSMRWNVKDVLLVEFSQPVSGGGIIMANL